jgi:hypothetical protein
MIGFSSGAAVLTRQCHCRLQKILFAALLTDWTIAMRINILGNEQPKGRDTAINY